MTGYTSRFGFFYLENVTRRKKKIAAAIYRYQADCDGAWGEIHFDFEKKRIHKIPVPEGQVIRLFCGHLKVLAPSPISSFEPPTESKRYNTLDFTQ